MKAWVTCFGLQAGWGIGKSSGINHWPWWSHGWSHEESPQNCFGVLGNLRAALVRPTRPGWFSACQLFARSSMTEGSCFRTHQGSELDRSMICPCPSSGHMTFSWNRGTIKASILVGFPIQNHWFWESLFMDTPIYLDVFPDSNGSLRPPAPSVSPELTPEAPLLDRALERRYAQVIYLYRTSMDLYQNVTEKGFWSCHLKGAIAPLMSTAFLEALPCSSGPEFLAPEVWRQET